MLRVKGDELRLLLDNAQKESKGIGKDELRTRIMAKYRLNIDGAELNLFIDGKQ